MTERDLTERAQELSRLWQGQALRLEEPPDSSERRHRVVPALAAAIARACERRRHERNTRRALGAFAVAAAAALAFGVAHFSHAPVATNAGVGDVRALSGVVSLVHDARAEVVDHASLQTGDALSMAPSSRAEVRLSNLVVADVEESSELLVVPPKGSTHRLRLDRGRLEAKVDDRPSAMPKLVVETPDVEVVVTGTIFSVDVANPEPTRASVTRVAVDKGRIVVRRGGKDIAAVTAGEHWSSESVEAVAAAPEPKPQASPGVREEPRVPAAESSSGLGTLANENRLFRAAIDARNQGDDRGAIAKFTELLSKYPKSLLTGESRAERLRALVRTGDKAEAAREARRYLADYPNGFAAEEARHVASDHEASP